MPELPEVESYRRLAEAALGRTVARIHAPDAWFLKEGATSASVRRALVRHQFTAARRVGKLLLLDTGGGPVLGLRFGMTGSLWVDGADAVGQLLYAPRRHHSGWERFAVRFEDGGSLVVNDPRRLGGVVLDPDLDRLGPDAGAITRAQLAGVLAGSSAPLKARLLDQARVAGIGNLIADELLWRAGLDPGRPAGSLTPDEVAGLHRQLRRTLDLLDRRGGSHMGDLLAERRTGGRCPKDGAELVRATVGGRTTWWCPVHQV